MFIRAVDLVTLDDLTGEALLESSQRAEHLAETFRRRQEPLSDPGPPGLLPPRNKRANVLLKIAALWMYNNLHQNNSISEDWN